MTKQKQILIGYRNTSGGPDAIYLFWVKWASRKRLPTTKWPKAKLVSVVYDGMLEFKKVPATMKKAVACLLTGTEPPPKHRFIHSETY